MVRPVSSSGAG